MHENLFTYPGPTGGLTAPPHNTSFFFHNMSKELFGRLSDCFSPLLFGFLAFFDISKKIFFSVLNWIDVAFCFLLLLELLFKDWFPHFHFVKVAYIPRRATFDILNVLNECHGYSIFNNHFAMFLTFYVCPLPSCYGGINFSKTAAWGGGYFLEEAFAWGDQQFSFNIFVFVILWFSDKEYQIIIQAP